MAEEQIAAVMKYIRGEISFAEWIETGGVTGDAEQNEDDNEVEMKDGDGEGEVAAPATQQGAPDQEQKASLGRSNRFHSIKNFMVLKCRS